MGRTHRVTGLAVGAVTATGLRVAALPPPAPVASCVVGVALALLLTSLAGRAALWADYDHHNSTATHSMGFVSEALHEFVHAASCRVFDLTATEADVKSDNFRGHRGLSHFGITAVVLGFLMGAAVWTVTVRQPVFMLGVIVGCLVGILADHVWTDLVGTVVGTGAALAVWYIAPRSLALALVTVTAVFVFCVCSEWFAVPIGAVAAVLTAGAVYVLVPTTEVDWTAVGSATGPGLGLGMGLAVAGGMIAHSLGDAATKTGVPLLWPLKIDGHRYYAVHIRREGYRLHTGQSEWAETKLRAWSWGLVSVAALGWWPGLLDLAWHNIPWPWAA